MQILPPRLLKRSEPPASVEEQRDILSVRLRNRATLLRMMARGECGVTCREMRREVRAIAADRERDAEIAMTIEVRASA